MPSYLTPGVFVEEQRSAVAPIEGASTSVAAFVGVTVKGPINQPTLITSLAELVRVFGGPIPVIVGTEEHYLYYAVRHFFIEGGRKCYVVRAAGYSDVNDAASLQAQSAFATFDAIQADQTTTVGAALRVEALTPGTWGDDLEVQVENASKFSLLLQDDITGSATLSQITLAANADVQVGSVLFLVRQITGVVQSVDVANKRVVFQPGLTAESARFDFTLTDKTQAFSPDMKLAALTSLAEPLKVTASDATATVVLDTVINVRGEVLKAGDIINFNRGSSATIVVKRLSEKLLPSGERAMVVEFEPAGLPSLARAETKVYARDFDLIVRSGGTVVETHTHLSLVDRNRRDYVNDRLAPEGNPSAFIVARAAAGTNAVSMTTAPFTHLAAGDDGLTGTPPFGPDDLIGSEVTHSGLHALDTIKDASILCVPNASDAVAKAAIAYCEARKDLFFVMDLPSGATDPAGYVDDKASSYAAIYFPWIVDDDPITGKPLTLPPSGAIAGVYARTDAARGVHKAPAGTDDGFLRSAVAIQRVVTKGENDLLYQKRVNVIRAFPEGILVWGARTLSADPAWRYVNVRRLFIFLEQSIERGLQWVVFEPNDLTLWKSIKRNVAAFLRVQWEVGALVGPTEDKAFFVRCDETTNTPATVSVGQVITEIGVAPSKPAEFVVFRLKQLIARS